MDGILGFTRTALLPLTSGRLPDREISDEERANPGRPNCDNRHGDAGVCGPNTTFNGSPADPF